MPDSGLTFLVYVSSAVRLFDDDELLALLRQSRARNARDGITGLLLYKDGNFIQLLEGAPAAGTATHARITGDARHKQVMTLLQGPLDERLCPHWSMAYRPAAELSAEDAAAFSAFLELRDDASGDRHPHRALRLLDVFRRNLAR